ncbi:LSM domain protein [Staphylococcus pseudintermedius]|nr:LSM domain protein [Staphylococcus pseudintermedius]MDE9882228.1 LSM domain protein [Staphylococcus pseudintermedius]MDE9889276.1 LSM domain protein [Staphylococcus pseudintermedius]MDE9891553.1 LSM domain protein [Staphylococcus pseudintermedius]MDE9896136.1 LSM domain protein [Staphylococcus pseudintermedius]
MKLWTYVGKNVLIELTDGLKFTGKAIDYDDKVANESGEDSIILDNDMGGLYDFNESEIKSIKILD